MRTIVARRTLNSRRSKEAAVVTDPPTGGRHELTNIHRAAGRAGSLNMHPSSKELLYYICLSRENQERVLWRKKKAGWCVSLRVQYVRVTLIRAVNKKRRGTAEERDCSAAMALAMAVTVWKALQGLEDGVASLMALYRATAASIITGRTQAAACCVMSWGGRDMNLQQKQRPGLVMRKNN